MNTHNPNINVIDYPVKSMKWPKNAIRPLGAQAEVGCIALVAANVTLKS